MPRRLISTAAAVRRKLIQKADNEWLVTWEDMHKETKQELKWQNLLQSGTLMPSEDWLARQVRAKSAVHRLPGKMESTIDLDRKISAPVHVNLCVFI